MTETETVYKQYEVFFPVFTLRSLNLQSDTQTSLHSNKLRVDLTRKNWQADWKIPTRKRIEKFATKTCGNDWMEVISTRMSVTLTRKVWSQHSQMCLRNAQVWFRHANVLLQHDVCDLKTKPTKINVILPISSGLGSD
jgi:hypothetical protein